MENLKRFFVVIAVISVLNGIGLLLAPNAVLTTYGIESTPGASLGFRLLGLTVIEFGLINWFVRYSHDWIALRGLLIGGTVGYILGLIVSAWATLTHIMNPGGWVLVVTYAVLLIGYLYSLWAGTKKFGTR
jgi:xanthine/uracil permease